MRYYIFYNLIFLLFYSCSTRGKRVGSLTKKQTIKFGSEFENFGTDICDLGSVRHIKKAFNISNDKSEAALKQFSQNLDFSLSCLDKRDPKEDAETKNKDIIDDIFSFYKDEVFSLAGSSLAWRVDFFTIVKRFQKSYFLKEEKNGIFQESDNYNRVKLDFEDLIRTQFIRVLHEDSNEIRIEVSRFYWNKSKIPILGKIVAGLIEAKGELSIKKNKSSEGKNLVFKFSNSEDLMVSPCDGCKNIEYLKNTKKIKELVTVKYRPGIKDAPNLFFHIERQDGAIQPAGAPDGIYEREAKKAFEKVLYKTSITHFSYLGKIVLAKSPEGIKAIAYKELIGQLNKNLGPVLFKNPRIEMEFKEKHVVHFKMRGEENADNVLEAHYDISKESFDRKKGTFVIHFSHKAPYAPLAKALRVKPDDTTHTRSIKVSDNTVFMDLKPEKETAYTHSKDEVSWVNLFAFAQAKKLQDYLDQNSFLKEEAEKGLDIQLKDQKITFKDKESGAVLKCTYKIFEDSFDYEKQAFQVELSHAVPEFSLAEKLRLKKRATSHIRFIKFEGDKLFLELKPRKNLGKTIKTHFKNMARGEEKKFPWVLLFDLNESQED